MKALSRSRTVRSIASSPVDSPQKEREPFNTGPYRAKSCPPGGYSGRRSRQNSENVPPEGSVNVSSTLKVNMSSIKDKNVSLTTL